MKKSRVVLVAVMACLVSALAPAVASDFVVLSVSGALEPEGLLPDQELASGTQLRLEPWGRVVLREAAGCGLTHVINGAPEHQLQPTPGCSTIGKPSEVAEALQQGMAFAAALDPNNSAEAKAVVERLVNESGVYLTRVSEQGGNSRRCPSGYALSGLRCSGEHCAFKDLVCHPYLDGQPDPKAKETKARMISEEFPNIARSKSFLIGLACNGPFCDNIMPYPIKTPSVKQGKQCDWTPWSKDVPGEWLACGEGQLVSGIRCNDDYCGNIGVYCCNTVAP